MIRTGYLRWEIDVTDARCPANPRARAETFQAAPLSRVVRVKSGGHAQAAERFVRGETSYDDVLHTLKRAGGEVDVTVPDVGPRPFRYSESDRAKTPKFWMEKLQREANAFAYDVVR